jgi:uncharacterized protein
MIRRGWVLGLVLGAAAEAAIGPDALLAKLAAGTNLVHDHAGVFSASQKSDLESFLREAERSTSAEIAVVALASLDGGDVDDFAARLFARWGIGKKSRDNGLLLLAAIEDRKVRIEVGYGLEGVLPDARTGRILDEHVIPEFKEQRYAEGLIAGAVVLAHIAAHDAGVDIALPASMNGYGAIASAATGSGPGGGGESVDAPGAGAALGFFAIVGGLIAFLIVASKKGWIKSTPSSGGSGGSSGSRSGSRSGGSGFGGGRSGGGGASRGW